MFRRRSIACPPPRRLRKSVTMRAGDRGSLLEQAMKIGLVLLIVSGATKAVAATKGGRGSIGVEIASGEQKFVAVQRVSQMGTEEIYKLPVFSNMTQCQILEKMLEMTHQNSSDPVVIDDMVIYSEKKKI